MITVRGPSTLIAAIPAVLGFNPENSLVLITATADTLTSVLRVDLSGSAVAVDKLVAAIVNGGADSVIAVVIGDYQPACPECDQLDLIELGAALLTHGITLARSYQLDAITDGACWRNLETGETGAAGAPGASVVAAEAVLAGRRLVDTRAELVAEIAPDSERAERVRALIGTVTPTPDDPTDGPMTDADIAVLAVALSDGTLRDIAYHSAAAGVMVWTEAARALPDPYRGAALAVVAFGAYARGDGPRAGVAIEAALQSDPGNAMAQMLDAALQGGMPPSMIRQLVERKAS